MRRRFRNGVFTQMGSAAPLSRQFALTEISMIVASADQSGEPMNVIEHAEAILKKYPDCGLSVDELCEEIQRLSSSKSGDFKFAGGERKR